MHPVGLFAAAGFTQADHFIDHGARHGFTHQGHGLCRIRAHMENLDVGGKIPCNKQCCFKR